MTLFRKIKPAREIDPYSGKDEVGEFPGMGLVPESDNMNLCLDSARGGGVALPIIPCDSLGSHYAQL